MRNVVRVVCILFAVIGAILLVGGFVGMYQDLIANISMAVMGGVFLAIPSITFGLHIRRRRTVQCLKTEGRIIHGKVSDIYRDTSYSVQGENPWRIAVKWLNPQSRKVHIFKSDHIWYNPSDFVKVGDEIEVRVDPRNPKKHWVNIDHLPERAD